MTERLMNPERPYGEPEYSKLSAEISLQKSFLRSQLDQEGQRGLEKLSDTYIHQGNMMLSDAFADGFWTAVKLMLEFMDWEQHSK